MSIAIDKMILESEKFLKNESNSVIDTGNRPRFPMIIICNNHCENSAFESIERYLKRIWPQTTQYIPIYKYDYNCESSTIIFKDYKKNFTPIEKSLAQLIDGVQSEKSAFDDFQRLRLYNFVETSQISDVKEFENLYKIHSVFSSNDDLVLETMLIILLDDSNERRKISNEIREYISKNHSYNSTVIISNRTFGNYIERGNEWYRIAADTIVLSNNDAISSYDDQDVRTRSEMLFGKNSTFTVSYKLFEKPINDIVKQMLNLILNKAFDCTIEEKQYNYIELVKKIGFEKSENFICNKYFNDNPILFDEEKIKLLPIRKIPPKANENILKLSYKEYCEYSYSDVFEQNINLVFQSKINTFANLNSYVDEFKKYLCDNLTIGDINGIDNDVINKIFSIENIVKPNPELPVSEYYKEYLKNYIKRDYLYPQFKNVLTDLKKDAAEIKKFIWDLKNEMNECVPVDSGNLGTIYQTITEEYLKSYYSANIHSNVLNLSNSKEKIVSELILIFQSIVKEKLDLFSLPFVEEWQKRLNLAGENIYHQISKELTDEADNNIRLHGHFRPDHILKSYLFNLGYPDKKQTTRIYDYLKKTFENDNTVQYFNTGYDDAIEGLTFVPLSNREIM